MRLTNTGNGVIEFFGTCSHSRDSQNCDNNLEAKWLCVQPKSGAVEPGMSIDLIVRYFPRITGEFSGMFLMEVFTLARP